MGTGEKVMVGVASICVGFSIATLFVLAQTSGQNSDLYKQACAERNGVTVYNGRHYECFVKG